MAALDLPPVLGLVGDARHAFGSRPGPRRLARLALVVNTVACGLTWGLIARAPYSVDRSVYAVVPMVFVLIAGVGLAIRRAQVWLDAGGLRWGWSLATIRVEPQRIREIHVYLDGLALAIGRGAPWFLARRDWADFDTLARAASRSGRPVVAHGQPAPWRARLQAYGRVLDGLMVASMLGAAIMVLAASGA